MRARGKRRRVEAAWRAAVAPNRVLPTDSCPRHAGVAADWRARAAAAVVGHAYGDLRASLQGSIEAALIRARRLCAQRHTHVRPSTAKQIEAARPTRPGVAGGIGSE